MIARYARWLRDRFRRPMAPILIYQPGKVGSLSVQASLEEAYKALDIPVAVSYGDVIKDTPGGSRRGVVIYHSHALNHLDQREQFVRETRTNPQDSLELIARWRSLRQEIDDHPRQRWNIINLVRDPVALKVSAFFQLIHQHIPDWEQRLEAGELSLADLDGLFFSKSEFGFAGLDRWYDNQIKALWGLDVLSVPFDRQAGYQVYSERNIRLMVIRLEDLNRVAEKAFAEFLGLKDFKVISTNVGDEKAYARLYQEFKKRPLPAEYVEKGYQTRFARHFYTAEEIEACRRRWLQQ